MIATEPLPLHHSWPIVDAAQRFDLGLIHDAAPPAAPVSRDAALAARWACDLADNTLDWSPGVYDLFGLPRGACITRAETVALYCEESRAAMERLRDYAIRHRRGFTLDVRIRPAVGDARWMRLVTMPVTTDRRVIRLEGLKHDVTDRYR